MKKKNLNSSIQNSILNQKEGMNMVEVAEKVKQLDCQNRLWALYLDLGKSDHMMTWIIDAGHP